MYFNVIVWLLVPASVNVYVFTVAVPAFTVTDDVTVPDVADNVPAL